MSQGDTRAGEFKNIQEAITLYVEDCRDAGDPVLYDWRQEHRDG